MVQPHAAILKNAIVVSALRQAWQDSQPGVSGGHEEGGFIQRDTVGILSIDRWPQGARDTIDVPPHQNCKINGNDIVPTFHTHPNTGADYLQEPSQTDQRAVRDDPNLKGAFYVGEFVISNDAIYLIAPNGQVSEIGKNRDVIG